MPDRAQTHPDLTIPVPSLPGRSEIEMSTARPGCRPSRYGFCHPGMECVVPCFHSPLLLSYLHRVHLFHDLCHTPEPSSIWFLDSRTDSLFSFLFFLFYAGSCKIIAKSAPPVLTISLVLQSTKVLPHRYLSHAGVLQCS